MTAWQMCREAELKDVDGYVFQESSMSPSTSSLEMRNGFYPFQGQQLLSFSCLDPPTIPFKGHSFGRRSSLAHSHSPGLSQPVPEQVCEPACRHSPQEVGQCVEIPDVKLVVEGAAKADANEIGGEEGRDDL